jgi:hypothetical protein
VPILAGPSEIGLEFDAATCSPTGRSDPHAGRDYRLRYARNFPKKLQGNA